MATSDQGPAAGRLDILGRLDVLTTLADDLAGHFDLQPLLERILRHMMELLGCDSGSVCTVDEAAGTYRKEVDVGVSCEAGRTFPLDEGVTGAVVRARSALVIDEYGEVPGGHIGEPDRSELHGVIGVPIRWNNAIIGTCIVFSRDADRRFTVPDTELVQLFATHAGIAIMNARLHAQAAERASESAAAAEREAVLRDVHDTVGRGLAAVLLQLDAMERRLTRPEPEALRALAEARASARAALAETRRAVLGLEPALLNGHSLGEALGLELAWVKSTSGLATRLVTIGEPRTIAPEVGRHLFRIAQESLTNVLEHAHAHAVRVGVVYGDASITVLVEDDGRGFDAETLWRERGSSGRSLGLGLRGLVARARYLHGSILVDSTPGWGTRVRAEVPYEPGDLGEPSRSRWRVLVVHPNPVARAGLVRMLGLTEPDLQVVGELADPAQAAEAYDLLHPHVVLAPLHMAHVDGVQLTSYLRALDRQAAVVLVVDSVADDRVQEAARGGAVGFVGNDIDAAALARAVVAAARGDSLVDADLFHPATGGVRSLTPRERQVRELIEEGLAYKQIASRLGISIKTVEKHVGAVLRKTGAPSRAALHG